MSLPSLPLLAAIDVHSFFFLLFAATAVGFGTAVLLTSNVVRMAFYLTLCLGSTAGLFFLAGAEFLGAMQFMIYVGGTLVLLIFGVMLTAQSRFVSMKTHSGEWIMGGVVGGALLLTLVQVSIANSDWNKGIPQEERAKIPLAEGKTSTPVGVALLGIRVDEVNEAKQQKAGLAGYHLPFVIVSMHLLVVLIGAGYMARAKKAAGGMVSRNVTIAPAKDRKRSFFVAVGLLKGIVTHVVLAALCILLAAKPSLLGNAPAALEPVTKSLASASGWLFPMLAILFVLNAIVMYVVWNWQKWGVVALVILPFVQAMTMINAKVPAPIAIVFLVLALLPVAALIGLLVSGKRPTVWSQMD